MEIYNKDGIALITGNAYSGFAELICNYLHVDLTPTNIKYFSNTQPLVQIKKSVRGKHVFVVQTGHSPFIDSATLFLEAMGLCFAAKDAGASKITLVSPYSFFPRSDKKDKPRLATFAKMALITFERVCGVNGFLTMHLHDPHLRHYTDNAPVDELYAPIVFAKTIEAEFAIKSNASQYVLVAPDFGMKKTVQKIATALGLDPKKNVAVIDKERVDDSESAKCNGITGDVQGKTALMFDDEVLSGRSLAEGKELLIRGGVSNVYAIFTHPILSGDAYSILHNAFNGIFTTNTIALNPEQKTNKFKFIDVSTVFGEAIARIYNHASLSELTASYLDED